MAGLLQFFSSMAQLAGSASNRRSPGPSKLLTFGNDELIHESLSSWKHSGQQKYFLSLVQDPRNV